MAKETAKKAVKKAVTKTAKKPAAAVKKTVPAVKKPPVPPKKTVVPAKKAAAKAASAKTAKPQPTVKKLPIPPKKAAAPAKKPPVAVKKPSAAAVKPVPVVKKPATPPPAAVAAPPSVVKTSAAKTPPAAKERKVAVANRKLTEQEVEGFKSKLLSLRSRLCGNIDAMTNAAMNKNTMEASGEATSSPIHMADVGSDNFEQEQTLTFVQAEGELLDLIDDALERINDGTYGNCESCDCPIPKERLNYRPYASMCVKCAEIAEQQQQEDW